MPRMIQWRNLPDFFICGVWSSMSQIDRMRQWCRLQIASHASGTLCEPVNRKADSTNDSVLNNAEVPEEENCSEYKELQKHLSNENTQKFSVWVLVLNAPAAVASEVKLVLYL